MMFEPFKEALRAPLQVQTEDLLSDMTLGKSPEILRLLSRALNLSDDDINAPEIIDRNGNVYKFTLIKRKGKNQCLLRIPIEISTLQGRNKGGVFDVLERVKNALILKYGGDIYLLIIHDGSIHVSFKTNAVTWNRLHENLIVKFIDINELLQLREEDQEACQIFLEKLFNLDHRPAEAEIAGKLALKKAPLPIDLKEVHPSPKYEAATDTGPGQPTTSISQPEKPTKITVLFLAANPTGTTRLDLDVEYSAIEDEIDSCKFRDRFNLRLRFALRADEISKQLLKHNPQIVHFSGHGSKAGELILRDATGQAHSVDASSIARLFSVLKDNIRCVVLNACYSETQAMLISRHIDCVIGMSKAIGDEAAIRFAQGFYRGLGFGKDLDAAFKLGCTQIDLQGLDEEETPKIIWKNDEPKKIVLVDIKGNLTE